MRSQRKKNNKRPNKTYKKSRSVFKRTRKSRKNMRRKSMRMRGRGRGDANDMTRYMSVKDSAEHWRQVAIGDAERESRESVDQISAHNAEKIQHEQNIIDYELDQKKQGKPIDERRYREAKQRLYKLNHPNDWSA
jgi:hypothetical protein